jgi:hypothetical protein
MATGPLGLKPSEFWDMTIAEFMEMADGYKWRRELQVNDLHYHAWLNAALTMWVKELPKFEDLTGKPVEKQEQTDDQMLANVKLLNAAFGGKVIEVCD